MADDSYSYTVEEFCEVERISRSMVYKLWSQGKGPRFYMVGSVRRISHEARIGWQRQLEDEAVSLVEGGA
jgi:excisionase family DNA binding protein